ncbi:MAG: dihydrofolate reductase family protein [Patescibacteria group bacterium]|nr:dihydrofolate reductase family protein [Patescibacteria group bacterium]MDE2438708.1 dihydrofolate reductase family protein [Patescibacteria group bacterium]
MDKPYTTLFMLMSVDGKISTGDSDSMDVDQDFPKISGIKEGLNQYYEIEKQTDFFSLNSGRVWVKIGANEKREEPKKIPVNFVVIDNKPHLKETGLIYYAKKSEKLIIVTNNESHPAFALKNQYQNIELILYKGDINLADLLGRLKTKYGANRLTIQTGGTLNAEFMRQGLIDRVLIVVAPALVGGKDTSTLIDGESLHSTNELFKIKALEFVQAKPLNNSYLLLEYTVKNI